MNHDPRLYNADLAPVAPEKRLWTKWNIAALWIGMAICIPSYNLAASLMKDGMYWWQALITITLGNIIVLFPMILNAHAGTKYGISCPVFLRSSFGVLGANIPAIMRALVACGWFGIQTWIGGLAIYILGCTVFGVPIEGETAKLPILGITGWQFFCFMIFWVVNMIIVLKGVESVKWMENWGAPFLLFLGFVLLGWAVVRSGGFSKMFSEETVKIVREIEMAKKTPAEVPIVLQEYDFWKIFFPSLTAMVAFWATLALNIPDFTCYARSQKDQILGQMIGLPITMALFSFIGIAVTAATVVIYKEPIWDPVVLVGKFGNPIFVAIAMFGLAIATLTTNIAANVVSPANCFSNLFPSKISFKTGGMITGFIGIVIMPWRLYMDMGAYIFTWLIGYGGMLGAIAGVMITDYWLVKRTHIVVDDLYRMDGIYAYGGSGFNWRAITALILGILPNVPGFLQAASNKAIQVPQIFNDIYVHAWLVGLLVAGVVHTLLSLSIPPKK
ncbi:MAG: NCS1 family nucleobase:cation symporter-1 [Planctomycetota bacterium]